MMYTERDRPFLLRRPLQTSLDTTFSPAFWRRDYPLRVFDHALGGGSDCRFRVRGAEGVAGGLWLWGSPACPRPGCSPAALPAPGSHRVAEPVVPAGLQPAPGACGSRAGAAAVLSFLWNPMEFAAFSRERKRYLAGFLLSTQYSKKRPG